MALEFDLLADTYVSNAGSFTPASVSICCFFYHSTLPTTANYPLEVDNNGVGGNEWVQIQVTATGTAQAMMTSIAGGGTGGSNFLTGMTAGNWYFLAVLNNGSNIIGYGGAMNATALTTVAVPALSSTPATLTHVRVGMRLGMAAQDGVFRVAGIKIWDVELSAAEWELERRQLLPARTANLNRFYPLLGSTSAANTPDYSGNARNLTTAGTAAFADGPPVPWCAHRHLRIRRTTTSATAALSGTVASGVTEEEIVNG